MQSTILLNSSENTHQVELEEQGRFVHSVLSAFGLPLGDWQGEVLPVEERMRLRKELASRKIEIVNDLDGGVKVYCESDGKYEMIAEFRKPRYVLRKDAGHPDPNKRTYLEMLLDTWFILDETE